MPSDEAADSQEVVFAQFALRGDRFENGRLPINALVELERYRTILLEAAGRAWLAAHPGSSLPEDLDREFDLAIREVHDGSSISTLERRSSPYDRYFDIGKREVDLLFQELVDGLALSTLEETDVSQDSVAQELGIDGVEESTDDPAESSPEAERLTSAALLAYANLPALELLGSSLEADETAEVPGPGSRVIELTFAARTQQIRPLVERARELLAPPPKPRREHVSNSVAGRLITLSPENNNYELDTLLYGKIAGRYVNPELTADLKEVLNSKALAPVVRITGRMSWLQGRLTRILEARTVELLEVESEPWSRRIVELASLPESWDAEGEDGRVISFVALDAAREILRLTSDMQSAPTPGIFPRVDGGVDLEWSTPQRMISVEIDADGQFFVHDLIVANRHVAELATEDLVSAAAALREALQ